MKTETFPVALVGWGGRALCAVRGSSRKGRQTQRRGPTAGLHHGRVEQACFQWERSGELGVLDQTLKVVVGKN